MGEYAPEFAMEFAESESLHSLNISYNNIGQSAIELADSLSLLLSLHTLDVSSNAIGVHATKFARELAQSESIRVLDISNNNIGPEALNFAASLPPLLYSLDVSRNNIDNDICKFVNLHGASPMVSSRRAEYKLRLPAVFFPLLLNIVLNYFFVNTYRRNKISDVAQFV